MATRQLVETELGWLSGRRVAGVWRFCNVPYAAPPVRELRFLPPQQPVPWAGIRPARAFGPRAPQRRRPCVAPNRQSEDCLTLNIWTPTTQGRFPVVAILHGGGFTGGSGSSPIFDGAKLAAECRVVVATLNYRLGALGFLELGAVDARLSGSANNGLRDQRQAIRWLARNVEQFGGEPARMTLLGHSAGATSALAQATALSSRSAPPLQGAVIQSGWAHGFVTPRAAAVTTERMMEALRMSSFAELQRCPAHRIVDAQSMLTSTARTSILGPSRVVDVGAKSLPFLPVIDGDFLIEHPIPALRRGATASTAVIVGTTSNETGAMIGLRRSASATELQAKLCSLSGATAPPATLYPTATRPGRAAVQAVDDLFFQLPAVATAEAQITGGGAAYMYRFERGLPFIGACHGSELPHLTGLRPFGPTRQLFGRRLRAYWARFFETGCPGVDWPCYDLDQRPVMCFSSADRVVPDRHRVPRRYWTDAYAAVDWTGER